MHWFPRPITLNRVNFGAANQLWLLAQGRRVPPSCLKIISAFSSSVQEAKSSGSAMGKHSLDDILLAIRSVVPPLSPGRHKGQAGKIAVIGGCREYTGAPYFSAISALKIGADLSHVFCTNGAATVIKSYSPELIVHPIFMESHEIGETEEEKEAVKRKALAEITKWLSRFNCLVVGPGLGRDPLVLDCVAEVIREARARDIPIVLDGDGLSLVTNDPGLISGYALATLTPNINEHKRLSQKSKGSDHEVQPDKIPEELKSLASRLGGVTIIQKGSTDYISDGTSVLASDFFGAPRRCGGQGDILTGCVAVFTSWAREFLTQDEGSTERKAAERLSKNPAMIGALAGSIVVRKAAEDAFARHRRSTLTSTIIECLEASAAWMSSVPYEKYLQYLSKMTLIAELQMSKWVPSERIDAR